MVGRTVGMERAADAARWAGRSPRLARALALYVVCLLTAASAVVGVRSREGPAGPGPVFQLAEAAEAHPVPEGPALSGATARRRPHSRGRSRPRPPAPVKGWAYWGPRVRQCESTGNYRAHSATTSASGAYQILDSTWQGRFGLAHAGDATPAQQDRAAEELYRAYG